VLAVSTSVEWLLETGTDPWQLSGWLLGSWPSFSGNPKTKKSKEMILIY
jgi:hypothetical protein